MRTRVITTVLGLLMSICIWAQTETKDTTQQQKCVVTTTSGQEYIGLILSDDGREILMDTEQVGKIYIQKSDISSIILLQRQEDVVHGEYRASGPFTTRYAFTTNAFPIVKGENYGLINLYGPDVHFAITNRMSFALMSTWVGSPMVFVIKYTIPTSNPQLHFSLGSMNGSSGYINTFRGFGGLHFANITLGNRMQNMTFAAGYLYIKDGTYIDVIPEGMAISANNPYDIELYKKQQLNPMFKGPVFSIAGIARVGAKASFVFDSMFGFIEGTSFTDEVTEVGDFNYTYATIRDKEHIFIMVLMPGMRFQSTENKAFQVSLAGVTRISEEDGKQEFDSFPIPMCTWFYRF